VFARPLQIGDSLVVATTTGDTTNLCDFNPDDPGNLLLLNLSDLNALDLRDSVAKFGPVFAPITEYGKTLYVHKNTSSKDQPRADSSVFSDRAVPRPTPPPPTVIAEVFGVLGTQNNIMQRLIETFGSD